MECSFSERKWELLEECRVSTDTMSAAAGRLDDFMKPFLDSFCRCKQASHARTVVRGLCSDLKHKNSESIAYFFGMDRKTIQHFIGESKWDDLPLRMEIGKQIGEQLGESDGVLAFDPSAFPKSGKQSVGVKRQWCGRKGKVDNCQVAVYLAYVSSKGHSLVDTELYLPEEWTTDENRMERAGVPKDRQRFRTRHEICLELLDRHGDQLPHTWITGDDELGRPIRFRRELQSRNEQYLLAVPCNTSFRDLETALPAYSGTGRPAKRPLLRVDRWAAKQTSDDWTTIEVRDGEKGPLIVEAMKRHVETRGRNGAMISEEVLVVIRYRDRDSRIVKKDYYLSNAEKETPLSEFCRAAKAELRVEECLRRGKSQTGMADYEVRHWSGWHHHQTLSLLASWFLNVETRRAEKKDTGNYLQSGATRNRVDPAKPSKMRYTPGRQMANRTTFAA